MDSFKVLKTKSVDSETAVKQLTKFIQKENDAKMSDNDASNTTRARLSDDVLSQLEAACTAMKENSVKH
jgi:hypothetical protein